MVSEDINPENLSPTEDAANYYAIRVHLQDSQWKQLDLKCLNSFDMGWIRPDACLKPIKTELDAAPDFTLNVVRCKCKMTSRNTCGSVTCSCKNNGLKCVQACGDCRGLSCNNANENLIVNIHEADYENIFDNLFDDISCSNVYCIVI